MVNTEVVTVATDRYAPIIRMVCDQLDSPHSRRAYERAIRDYLTWHDAQEERLPLSRVSVARYLAYVRDTCGYSASTINQRLAAIHRLAEEAHANGLIEDVAANGIRGLHGVKQRGVRAGNWLTREVAQALLNLPDTSTLRGMRDRALLALLLGCGLRRTEITRLTVDQIQQREGRWVAVDITGKGNRIRTVPMAAWVKAAIDAWLDMAGIKGGYVFKPLKKGGTLANWEPMHAQTVYDTLAIYAAKLGVPDLAPHDLRRTFAKLARKGGAPLEQIQFSLGHSSVAITEKYTDMGQDFTDAPSDHVGLRIE